MRQGYTVRKKHCSFCEDCKSGDKRDRFVHLFKRQGLRGRVQRLSESKKPEEKF